MRIQGVISDYTVFIVIYVDILRVYGGWIYLNRIKAVLLRRIHIFCEFIDT